MDEELKRPKKKKLSKKKRRRRRRRIMMITGIVLAVIIVAVAGAGLVVSNGKTVYPNVTVKGSPVGGLTREQAVSALESSGWNEAGEKDLVISLPFDISCSINYAEADAFITAENAANAALSYGRQGNIFANLISYIKSLNEEHDAITDGIEYNGEYIRSRIAEAVTAFSEKMAGEKYLIDIDRALLEYPKISSDGTISEDEVYEQAVDALSNNATELSFIPVNGLEAPDFDAILKTLHVEKKDAEFTDKFEIIPEVYGITFDASKAASLWESAPAGTVVEVPLALDDPEVTAEDLEATLYKDLLGEKSTYYYDSSPERMSNINLAVSILNGITLMPGETFSYNERLGERTEERGFKAAPAYSGDQVIMETGGGVCQVSSTLYVAVLAAQLDDFTDPNVEGDDPETHRECHIFRVLYLDPGIDATVSWPSPDFRFTNGREYPVKIVCSADDETTELKFQIWGTDTDGTYIVPSGGMVKELEDGSPLTDANGNRIYRGYTVLYRFDKDGNAIDIPGHEGEIPYVGAPYSTYFPHGAN